MYRSIFFKEFLVTLVALFFIASAQAQYKKPKYSLYAGLIYAHLSDDEYRTPTVGLNLDYQRIFNDFFALRFGLGFQRSYLIENYNNSRTVVRDEEGRTINEISKGSGFEGRYSQLQLSAGPVFYARGKHVNFYAGANVGIGQAFYNNTAFNFNNQTQQWQETNAGSGTERELVYALTPRLGLEFSVGSTKEHILDISFFYDRQKILAETINLPLAFNGIRTYGFTFGYRYLFYR